MRLQARLANSPDIAVLRFWRSTHAFAESLEQDPPRRGWLCSPSPPYRPRASADASQRPLLSSRTISLGRSAGCSEAACSSLLRWSCSRAGLARGLVTRGSRRIQRRFTQARAAPHRPVLLAPGLLEGAGRSAAPSPRQPSGPRMTHRRSAARVILDNSLLLLAGTVAAVA
jgi:hypothetical protein